MVLVDGDISNFMTGFIFFVSLYFWQSAKNSFNESSPSVQMKNMSSIKRSHIKSFFTVYLWKSLRSDVSNMLVMNIGPRKGLEHSQSGLSGLPLFLCLLPRHTPLFSDLVQALPSFRC